MYEGLDRCISYLFMGLITIPIAIILKKVKKNLTFWQALWQSFVVVFGVLLLISFLIMIFDQIEGRNFKTPETSPGLSTSRNHDKTQNNQNIKLTSTKRPTATKIPKPTDEQCTPAKSLSINQIGQIIEVCGKITYTGEENCPECPNGYYSYLELDNSFYILSYDWVFNSGWNGDCIMVKDKVELFGGKPAFVFGKREGYDGSECEILPDGTKSCSGGDYFKLSSKCR
jgi:hypothetical protein